MHTKRLFYYKNSNNISYTTTVQSNIAFERIGKPDFWIKHEASALEKKTLIITDWTLYTTIPRMSASPEIILLNKLAAQGFSIYIWQSDSLIKLTSSELLRNDHILQNIKLAPVQDIINIAIDTLQISHHQLYLLDDHEIKFLLSEEVRPRHIFINSFINQIRLGIKKEKMIKWINECNIPIKRVNNNFIEDKQEQYNFDKYISPLQLNYLRDANDDKFNATVNDLFEQKHAVIHLSDETIDLCSFLAERPLLESLEIHFSIYTHIDLKISEQVKLPFLHKLELCPLGLMLEATISLQQINTLLQLGPIQTLCLSNICVDNFPLDICLQKNNITSLIFSSSSRNINKTNANQLLSELIYATEKLTYLHVNNNSINLQKCGAALNNLTYLSYAADNEEDIIKLLSYTPKLEILDASIIGVVKRSLSQENNINSGYDSNFLINLPCLKILELTEVDTLTKYLSTPLLSQLYLNLTKMYENNFTRSLTKLKILELKNMQELSNNILTSFLSNNNLLETIRLDNVELEDDSIIPIVTSRLEKLNVLYIRDSQCCTERCINSFLTAAPNISHLDIEPNNNWYFKFDLSNIPILTVDCCLLSKAKLNLLVSKIELYENIIYTLEFDETKDNDDDESSEYSTESEDNPNVIQNNIDSPSTKSFAFIGANTAYDPSTVVHATKIFYSTTPQVLDPIVSTYRLSVHDKLIINNNNTSINDAFIMTNTLFDQSKLINIEEEVKSYDTEVLNFASDYEQPFFAKQVLIAHENWQPLASLTANDKLHCYHCNLETVIQLSYCTNNKLYYIRFPELDTPQYVKIDFLITTKTTPLSTLPLQLQSIIAGFHQYQNKPLELPEQCLTGFAFLQELYKQKVGACRHRAVLFKYICDCNNIQSRIITNDTHAFVEVFFNNEWITCDLGGYPVKIITTENHKVNLNPYVSPMELDFRQRLAIWNNSQIEDYTTYFEKILNGDVERRLIKVATHQLINLNLTIQQYAIQRGHRVFCINHPDDLSIKGPVLLREDDNSGSWGNFGGALHDIMSEQYADESCKFPLILIFNLNNFSATDLLKYNPTYGEGKIDGEQLPPNTIILGLIDPKQPNRVLDDAFYSRFIKIDDYCESITSPITTAILRPITEEVLSQERTIINLHHSLRWKTQLFGNWGINNNIPYFEPGEFQTALAAGLPIEFLNPPDCEHFQYFWQEAQLRNKIVQNGIAITLPRDLIIWCRDGFFWDDLNIKQTKVSKNAHILNPSTVQKFIRQYSVQDNNFSCMSGSGILDLYQSGDTVELLITRNISEDELDLIFTQCRRKNLLINLEYCTENLASIINDDSTLIISSSDRDVTLENLAKQYNDPIIIDCSAYTETDLIETLDLQLTGTAPSISFNCKIKPQAILKYLQQNRNVILTGEYSDELLDNLTVLCVNRRNQEASVGKLIIIQESIISKHITSIPNNLPTITTETIEPTETTDDLEQDRLQSILNLFQSHPYAYILGETGIGKSYFIKNYLAKLPDFKDHIFYGLEQQTLLKWVETAANPDSYVVLFIDEANFHAQKLSIFEGLFFPFPQIIIGDTSYPIDKQHKVIFASNPLSYGDQRTLPSLFKRHGGEIVWGALTNKFIIEKLIQPSLQCLPFDPKVKQFIQKILLISYDIAIKRKINVSPRHFQMSLLFMSACFHKHQNLNLRSLLNIFKRYCIEVFLSTAPKLEEDLLNKLKCISLYCPLPKYGPTNHYYLPSRFNVSRKMLDFLQLRNYLTSQPAPLCYSGLNLVIISGESGIGKSQWIRDLLQYAKIKYYEMHASTPLERKKLLLKAFDEGEIVVMDEINSVTSMEEWLNYLLEGKHPEEEYRPPLKPGFRLIGTQNSSNLPGRHVYKSQALQNRTFMLELSQYSLQEMTEIFVENGLDQKSGTALASALIYNQTYATNNGLASKPNLRNALLIAEEESLPSLDQWATLFTTHNETPNSKKRNLEFSDDIPEEISAPKYSKVGQEIFDECVSINSNSERM